jgi:hypothetical protein
VYQTERFGDFTYTIPNLTPGGTYLVRLHFAEIFWNAAGKRVFDVTINGTPALSRYDIFARAGGANRAIVEDVTATADRSGTLSIRYTSLVDNAKSSGIEVIAQPSAAGVATPSGGPIVSGGAVLALPAGKGPGPVIHRPHPAGPRPRAGGTFAPSRSPSARPRRAGTCHHACPEDAGVVASGPPRRSAARGRRSGRVAEEGGAPRHWHRPRRHLPFISARHAAYAEWSVTTGSDSPFAVQPRIPRRPMGSYGIARNRILPSSIAAEEGCRFFFPPLPPGEGRGEGPVSVA